MRATEEVWDLAGFRLAGRRWRSGERRVLALHGWLDNAASFNELAPILPGCDLIAIDLPGHGCSDHRPPTGSYDIWDDLTDLVRLLDALDWPSCHLMGHSRGGIIAGLMAAALPERVSSVVFLDAVWPSPAATEEVFDQLGRHVREHTRAPSLSFTYPSIDRALEARCRVANITAEAARPIVERGLRPVPGGWQWRSDPRLRLASAIKLDRRHNEVLMERLSRQHCLALFATGGLGGRLKADDLRLLEQIPWRMLDGDHHFHLQAAAHGIAEATQQCWDAAESDLIDEQAR